MSKPVLIIGAGPGGCASALTLRKLGRDVILYERAPTPQYKIGESFLPGTLSLLKRLGLMDRIDAAGFVKKPSATFIWGADEAPWTFSFATPCPEPWIFDHALQAHRAEFDGLLLDAAREAGVVIKQGHNVTKIGLDDADGVHIEWATDQESGRDEGSYVIDCSGQGGLIAREYKLRRYDEFYRSLAVWNYFKSTREFTGDLKGTTFSITFKDGWIWMIPLKDGTYSVGAVVDMDSLKDMKAMGDLNFLQHCLRSAPEVATIINVDEPLTETRIIREWSYDAEKFSFGRVFMSGDSACFTDPLFSQGVHLATQSGVSAAAAIDYLLDNPARADQVHAWYDRSYRESYSQYHEFLASFYSFASRLMPASSFWTKRRVDGLADKRFENKLWFAKLTGQAHDEPASGDRDAVEDFVQRSGNMINIGQHLRKTLTEDFTEEELNAARLNWISKLTKSLNRITAFRWEGDEVRLNDTFKIDPHSFELKAYQVIGNESDVRMNKYPLSAAHRDILAQVNRQKIGYKELLRQLKDVDGQDRASQIIIRLLEAGLIKGYDDAGEQVHVQRRLRFDGVGAEYEV
ncbi:tryptophan 7-halogenase [Andreprevotia chitinilytica]|uniref:tryptophan 7-halogenase n=1 Tax=Andreprevotia chitinilytica TaxID=396808 RepID=UPI00054F353A|nr:tryptophan 7-halogenase [Andreprevotia chitinilytica]